MTSQEIIRLIQANNAEAIKAARSAPATLPGDIEKALPTLDGETRELAVDVLAAQGSPGAAPLLLNMTGDSELQAAVAAANALRRLPGKPPADKVIQIIPTRQSPEVRTQLYLLVGESGQAAGGGADKLDDFRKAAALEKDEEARENAQAACVRLGGSGGVPERRAMLQRLQSAEADQALRCCDQVRYVGDPNLCRGLAPWIGRHEGVMRLGSDRSDAMVRMCDLAAWTAWSMGVKFALRPQHIANYEPAVLQAAAAAMNALPG